MNNHKLGSCKLVLAVVCRGEEFDVTYLTKNCTMWKDKNLGFFYLHSDPLPISSMENSRQPIVRVRAFCCSSLGTFTATFQPVTSPSSSNHSFPSAVLLIKNGSGCYLSKRERIDPTEFRQTKVTRTVGLTEVSGIVCVHWI